MTRALRSFTNYDLLTSFLGIFFLLNGLKPWIDIYFGISNQLVTGLQLILCLSILQILTLKKFRLSIFLSFFLIFIFSRYFSELLILFAEDASAPSFVSASFSALRFYMFVLLLLLLGRLENNSKVVIIRKIFIAYFILTMIYSIMQHPYLLDISFLRTAGGNIVSGNHLGILRMNGGIGGTVISYSNFLLAVSWVLFYCKFDKSFTYKCLLLCFGISTILCFSRSLFICLLVMFFVDLIMKKRLKTLMLLTISLCLATFMLDGILTMIIDGYKLMVGESDVGRISGWISMFGNSSSLEILMGSNVGGNTGLFTGGLTKVSGDGFIMGTINDFGIIGVITFYCLFVYSVFKLPNISPSVGISIVLTFMIMLFVNSGFEKLIVMLSYFVALLIISYMPSGGSGDAQKVVAI